MGKRRIILQIIVILGLVVGFNLVTAVPAVAQSTWYVATTGSDITGDGSLGNPWATIGFAISQATASDTINVAAGTYYERITLKDGVELVGAGAGVTTINGGGSGSVVTAIGVGSGTTLDGFTITNGSAAGGGMYNSTSSLVVSNCTFSGNPASHGGGIFNYHSSPTVTNCTFSGNSVDAGGGMYNSISSSPAITNNIIVSNTAPAGGGIWADGTSSPIIDYNNVWNNTPDNYVGCSAGAHDISQDPLFVDPLLDDYHLQASSPCIDAGNNSAPSLPSTDFEGQTRIWNSVVDIGVDEYLPAGTGLLRVATSPAVPTTIFVDNFPRNGYGLDWVKMPVGTYMLSFSDVPSFATPTDVQLTYYPGGGPVTHSLSNPIVIYPNTTTEVIVNFTPLGNLRIETSPPLPATIFVNGYPMNGWGCWVYLGGGQYLVSFQDIGYGITPPPLLVTVTPGLTTYVVGNYATGTSYVVP